MPYGPCMICGATNYPSSMGGPMICPQCDCDNFGQRRIEQQGTQLQQVIAERDQLAAKVAEAEIISTAALQRSTYLANTKLGFVEALDACQRGLTLWRDKPHNFKWWNRIDGTPIPNDLLVCIAEILGQTANADRATISALRYGRAEAREALEPFALVAHKYRDDDSLVLHDRECNGDPPICSVGDLRRARSTLAALNAAGAKGT